MAYALKSYRKQGNGIVVPESTGGFDTVESARLAGQRALVAREELQFSEVIDENTGAVVAVVKR